LEITNKVVVCVNLLDEAKKKGIEVDLKKLSLLLGVPVVGTVARKKGSLKKLLETIYNVCSGNITCTPKLVKYSTFIEDAILLLNSEVYKILPENKKYLSRWVCLKLLDKDENILKSIEDALSINLSSNQICNKLDEAKNLLEKNDIYSNTIRDNIVSNIISHAEHICSNAVHYPTSYNPLDRKLDKILTSKKFGIPIMILFLGIIFWLTIIGANYPSQMLSDFFGIIQEKLILFFEYINAPNLLTGILVNGMYQTVTWVVSVMLPPMAIFFPLFTILEDLGYLPRIAFNLDNYFKKACTSGKQALTMCMGFGCNAARSCWL